jgi:hypothetical protein
MIFVLYNNVVNGSTINVLTPVIVFLGTSNTGTAQEHILFRMYHSTSTLLLDFEAP